MASILAWVRGHEGRPQSYNSRIAKGFFLVSLFVLIGKLAGAAKEMTVAWRYGVSETVDAYVFIFNLITWPVSVWFGVLTVLLVPVVARIRRADSSTLPQFRSELFGVTLLAGGALAGLAYWGLPFLLQHGWAGLSGLALQQGLAMIGPLTLLLPIGLLISLFSAWMMAFGRYRNTLLEAIPALTILVALLVPTSWVSEPLVWGTIAGFLLQLASVAWPLQRSKQLDLPSLGFQSSAWNGFWGSFGIMAVSQILMSLTGIIDPFFAAHLGPGTIATFSYANRIMALILGLGATTISRVTLPIFSEAAAENDSNKINALAMRWAKLIFTYGVALMGLAWIFAPIVVELLFQRGAFSAKNGAQVSEVIRFSLLQIPAYFSAMVLATALLSQRQYAALLISSVLGVSAKILGTFVLEHYYGVAGIALGTAALYITTATYAVYKIRALQKFDRR